MMGGILYLVYRRNIIGCAKIEKHDWQGEDASVGLNPEEVGPGDRLTLRGALKRLPSPIPCMGFRNFRYTEKYLHKLEVKEAQKELRRLGLTSLGASRTQAKNNVPPPKKKKRQQKPEDRD